MDFIKITKRDDLPKGKDIGIRALAIILSLVFAGFVMMMFGLNPFEIYKEMVNGALGSPIRINQTILKIIPLIIISLGVLVAFKMKFWNIGAEGQIIMGATAATWVALNAGDLPRPVMIVAIGAAAMAAGGVWAFIPAYFKAKLGTNETIFTLMMNYIAIKIVMYLQFGPWKDPNAGGFPRIAQYPENALLPTVFGVHIGWIIALILVVIIHIFINHTKKGYEITVVGESVETARYAGMNIKAIIIVAMLISGGLCGLAGMIQAAGVERTLTTSITMGYGFTAIIIAWLARLKAPAVLVVCIAFAIMLQGGAYLQVTMQVPESVSSIVQGIILFFVLGTDFFLQYKVSIAGKFASKRKQKEVA